MVGSISQPGAFGDLITALILPSKTISQSVLNCFDDWPAQWLCGDFLYSRPDSYDGSAGDSTILPDTRVVNFYWYLIIE